MAYRIPVALFALMVGLACTEPRPGVIAFGSDACGHCRMTISDGRFAAQLVTQTGKVHRFDDPGCLAAFVASEQVPTAEIHSMWAHDYSRPNDLLNVSEAVFLRSNAVRTPMNSHIVAVQQGAPAASLQSSLGGELLEWRATLARVGQTAQLDEH